MATVRRNGSNLWYEIVGEKGAPITLIGGFALVDDQFEFCNQYLLPHHRLVHWHYRGVGKSDWSMTEPYSVESWVDDLAAVLDHAGIEKTSIWCTSTGTSIGHAPVVDAKPAGRPSHGGTSIAGGGSSTAALRPLSRSRGPICAWCCRPIYSTVQMESNTSSGPKRNTLKM